MSISHYILAGLIAYIAFYIAFCFVIAIFTLVCLYLTELWEGLK